MAHIRFDDQALQGALEELGNLEVQLSGVSERVHTVEGNLGIEDASKQIILKHLHDISAKLERETDKTVALRGALEHVMNLYRDTERRLADLGPAYEGATGSDGGKSLDKEMKTFLEKIRDIILRLLIILGILPGGSNNGPSEYAGEPVDMCTGSYVNTILELRLRGVPDLSFSRHYNSRYPQSGALGIGWSHDHERRLEVTDDALTLIDGDGRQERFIQGQTGLFVSAYGGYDLIERTENGYRHCGKHNDVTCFDADGRMLSRSNRRGTVEYAYENGKLTTARAGAERCLHFAYNEAGLLSAVSDNIGRTVSFDYDGMLLTRVVAADGAEERYAYNAENRLSALINADGVRILENRYDDQQRIVHQSFPDGTEMLYEYTDDALRFTDRNGAVAVYYHDERLRHIRTEFEHGVESYTYNDQNERVQYSDLNGAVWSRTFDANGHVTSLTDPLGRVTAYTYDADGNLTRKVYADGSEERRSYNDLGELIAVTDANGSTQTMRYENGLLVEVVDPDASRQTYSYDADGRLTVITDGNGAELRHEYDGAGRIIRRIDKRGFATEFAYDAMDRMVLIRDPEGNESRMTYTPTGKLAKRVDFDGSVESWEFNVMGKVSSYCAKNGSRTYFRYDDMSNIAEILLPTGGVIERKYNHANLLETERRDAFVPHSFTYDSYGRLVCERMGEEEKTYAYDDVGGLISTVDWDGRKTTVERDAVGRVTKRTYADGSFVRFAYDAAGHCVCESSSSGRETRYRYSPGGKLIGREDNAGNSAAYTYDANGKLLRADFGDGAFLQMRYDAEGNLIERKLKSGYTESYTYDALGRRTEVRDSEGRCRKLEYDAVGRVVRTVDANGNSALYAYEPSGKLTCMRDEAGQTTRYRYDDEGNLTALLKGEVDEETAAAILSMPERYQNPENDVWHLTSWKVGHFGNITNICNAIGDVECFDYDAYGRMSGHMDMEGNCLDYSYLPGGAVESLRSGDTELARYQYDEMMRIVGMQDTHGKSSFRFDTDGHLLHAEDAFGHAVRYDVDAAGRIRGIRNGESAYAYDYDAHGRLIGIELDGSRAALRYDDNGRLAERTYQNGLSERYAYTSAGQLELLERMDAAGMKERCTYRYDAFGNLLEKQEEARGADTRTTLFGYDALNRLISRTVNGELERTYCYDAFSNCTEIRERGHVTQLRYNVLNQLIEKLVDGETVGTYSYDARGNLIREAENGVERAYTYDRENHLAEVSASDGTSVRYLWDGMGHRLGKIVNGEKTLYVTDFSRTHHNVLSVEQADSRTNLLWDRALVFAENDGERRWYFGDERGSVSASADAAGSIDRSYRYDEFGNPASGSAPLPAFGFAGLQYDAESDSYFAQRRSYAPRHARFLSKDQERFIFTEIPESVNLYAYCRNNPLIFVDPEGTDCYIFYLPEWEGEARADQAALAKKYGYDVDQVHMIPINNNDDLTAGWNGMGTVNGQPVDIDTVVIDSHANPYGLGYNGSDDFFGAQDIRNLDQKDVKELVLYGCNAGHMDYSDTNPAAEFARRVDGAQVIASDGTVYSNPNGHSAQNYASRADEHFHGYNRYGDRDNQGWIEYRYVDGEIQTTVIDDKKMHLTDMTDYLRRRRGTMCEQARKFGLF